MRKKQNIVLGSAVAVAVALVAITVMSGDGSKPSEPDAAINPGQLAPPDAQKAAGDPGDGTPTSVQNPRDGQTAAPVSHNFRTPVRCVRDGLPSVGSLPGDSPNVGKKWVTVQRLQGSCDLSSESFHLRAINTRLAWRSDAKVFTAFLLDTAKGLEASAGLADADCSGPCADYQSLTNQEGDYTLRVQADGGPWEVVVQEYR